MKSWSLIYSLVNVWKHLPLTYVVDKYKVGRWLALPGKFAGYNWIIGINFFCQKIFLLVNMLQQFREMVCNVTVCI